MTSTHIDQIAKQYSYGRPLVSPNIVAVSVGEAHNPNERFNVFVARATFMFGDADGYETVELEFSQNQRQSLVDFLNFCSRCSIRYPNGKGGYDDYKDVLGYYRWVADEEMDEDDLADMIVDLEETGELHLNQPVDGEPTFYWPMEDGEWVSSFDSVEVVFYDEVGLMRSVALVTSGPSQ